MNSASQFEIQTAPLSRGHVFMPSAAEGAHAVFVGYVRDNNPAAGIRDVVGIFYQCYYELAAQEGSDIVRRARKLYDIARVYCAHRMGVVPVSGASLYVEVTGAHRAPVLQAVEFVIAEIKKTLPVWKQEIMKDGRKQWT